MLELLGEVSERFPEKIAIVRSIDTPLAQLTVEDICKKNGIGRKKFYTLFDSKYHILYWYIDLCASLSSAEIGKTLTWNQGIVSFLKLLDEERSVLSTQSAFFDENPRSALWYLDDRRRKNIQSSIASCGKTPITPLLRSEIVLYSSLVPRLVSMWTLPTETRTAEEYAHFWIDCVPRALYDALDLETR